MASASLLDALSDYLTPEATRRAASELGETEGSVAKALGAAGPALLAMLLQKSGDGSFMQQIMAMLTNSANRPIVAGDTGGVGGLGDLESLLGGASSDSPIGQLGGRFLSTLLGDQQSAFGNALAGYAGVKSDSASSLLNLAAPLLMGVLGDKVRSQGLDASGLARLLGGQRASIMNALPGALSALAGLSGAGRAADDAVARGAQSASSGGSGWLWPVLIGALLLGGLWMLLRGSDTPETARRAAEQAGQVAQQAGEDAQAAARGARDAAAEAARDTADAARAAANQVGDAAQQAANDVGAAADQAAHDAAAAAGAAPDQGSAAAADLGNFMKRQLPNGVELNVPANGMESRLFGFIVDPNRGVEPPVWFNFDRILFETGSARLHADSKEQLGNIAQILAAYPAVNLKIGGYTDNTGDPAANLKLSQDRADSVMNELVSLGVAAGRLSAEGYGEAHPVGDNATEEGRALNRRIAVRVTTK